MANINQCALILNQLMRSGKITIEKAREMGVKSLSARIKDLRILGVPIENAKDGGYILPYWLQKARAEKHAATKKKEETKLF